MQTNFAEAQLADPEFASSEKILRTCVHCGFCTATCPTYVLLGDELDSPRGRIYLMKQMLEQSDRPPTASEVKHVDRCLSCLSCMTTCPSGVHYMHLVDHARTHIQRTFRRPFADRWIRRLLGLMLPRPALFRLAMRGAVLAKPLARHLPSRLAAMLGMATRPAPRRAVVAAGLHRAEGIRRARVVLLQGCVQDVLAPQINAATVRLLARRGVDVVMPPAQGCCGALNHHLGQHDEALDLVKRNIAAWEQVAEEGGLDAIVINASGCGTTVKDYGFMLRDDPAWAERAERMAGLAKDITEFLAGHGLGPVVIPTGQRVAYHSACSMQHGQKLSAPPRALLTEAGFKLAEIPEGHLCCGSAGTYNLLQPEISQQLKARKLGNIAKTEPELVATGNIGCIQQLSGAGLPVVHTVELLDWATGGPAPAALAQ